MDAASVPDLEVSVVLPFFDEEGCVERLVREVEGVLHATGQSFEILGVDDASRDRTGAILDRLEATSRHVRAIHHTVNCGQSAALASGFRAARGAVVVTLDGDEQNDPASIPDLLAALARADAACGVRTVRRDSWVRRASSRIGNGFRNLVTGDRVTDAGCGFRALRREVLEELPVFNGLHRFLPTILRAQGFSVVEVPVKHRPRTSGRSKYGIGNRLVRGIVDCLAVRWYRRRAVRAIRVRERTPAVAER